MKSLLLILSLILWKVYVVADTRSDSLLLQYLKMQGLKEYAFDRINVYTNGTDKFNSLFADIRQAKTSIDVEYFIFANDSIGQCTIGHLLDAARRGVKVRLVIDGYKDHERGYGYDGPRLDSLRQQGIDVQIFDPWRRPYLCHVLRDHRKIVVIDQKIGYIGGLNVADYYINGDPEVYGGWRDTHIRITGEAVEGLIRYFDNAWNISVHGTDYERQLRATAVNVAVPDSDLCVTGSKKVVYFERSRVSKQKKSETRNAIIAAFNTAQDTLRIVSPYFLPTHTVRKALVNAIDRGVKVQILFSREGDNALLSAGNQHFSKRLLRHGAEVFLYRGAFHHSKIMMVDGSHSMVGSANLNSRSLKWDYEASCFVFDPEVTAELNAIFEQDCTNSDIMTIDDYRQKPLGKRLLGWLANRILTPFL